MTATAIATATTAAAHTISIFLFLDITIVLACHISVIQESPFGRQPGYLHHRSSRPHRLEMGQ